MLDWGMGIRLINVQETMKELSYEYNGWSYTYKSFYRRDNRNKNKLSNHIQFLFSSTSSIFSFSTIVLMSCYTKNIIQPIISQ